MVFAVSYTRPAVLLLLAALVWTAPAQARQTAPAPHFDCEALATVAGAELGLPPHLLPAIARVESGTNVDGQHRAWPWTVNQGGRGSYHASPDAALARVAALLAAGVRNVDLGCMQINWRWHNAEFDTAASMIDPAQNTRYAARYLRMLFDRHGDWALAVAHYHAGDAARGRAYADKVLAMQAQIGTDLDAMDCPPFCGPLRGNLHGLLLVGSGSLVAPARARHPMRGPLATAALPLISASN